MAYYMDTLRRLQDEKKKKKDQVYVVSDEKGKSVNQERVKIDTAMAPIQQKMDAMTSHRTSGMRTIAKQEDSWIKNILQVPEVMKDNFKRFDDGYQFGDITKTTIEGIGDTLLTAGGTIADAGMGITKGILNVGEGIGDAITYGTAQVLDWTGKDERADELRERASKDIFNDAFKKPQSFVNQASVLGDTGDKVTEGIGYMASIWATGQIGGAIGGAVAKGSKATKALSAASKAKEIAKATKIGTALGQSGLIFSNSTGTNMADIYDQYGVDGVTDGEAWGKSLGSAAIETTTELMLGMFGNADAKIVNGMANRAKTALGSVIARAGGQAFGEGLEEIVSYAGNYVWDRVVDAASKGEGAKFAQEWSWEDLWEQAGTAALTALVMGGGQTSMSALNNKTATNTWGDAINETARQQNTSAQLEELEDQKAKLEKKLGQNLSQTEINKTFAEMQQIDSQISELNNQVSLTNTTAPDDTVQVEGLQNAIAEKTQELQNSQDVREQQIIQEEINNLQEELNEATNAQQITSEEQLQKRNFTYEATDNEYKAAVYESASKHFNDTKETHTFVDVVAKIAEDRGTKYEFVNSEEIKARGYDIANASVNGLVTEDGSVLLNVDSRQGLDFILGHETTHLLEGTQEYQALQDLVIEYAKQKGIYEDRTAKLHSLYKGKGDINAELTSDLVGELLFTDQAFIENLSVKQPTLFEKIKNFISDLIVKLKGTEQEKQLRQLQRSFEKAYRTQGTKTTDTKYSFVGEEITKNNKDAQEGLALAKELHEAHADMDYIRQNTGWFIGKDGKWKAEIDDSAAKLTKKLEKNKTYKLGDILQHEALYKLQPAYRNIEVKTTKMSSNGSYNRETGTISLSNSILSDAKQVRSTLLHEIQHATQHAESWQGGTNLKKAGSWEAYQNQYGEKEAREVQARRNMPFEDRTQIAPSIQSNARYSLSVDDYGMQHRPSTIYGDGSNFEENMPDVFEHPEWYFSTKEAYNMESWRALKKVRNNPEGEITIYRATKGDSINEGDWVTPSRKYAEWHNESQFDGEANIIELKVKAKDIRFAGDDINEFGYFPNGVEEEYSLSPKGDEAAPIGNVFSEDLKVQLEKVIAPLQETVESLTEQLNTVANSVEQIQGNVAPVVEQIKPEQVMQSTKPTFEEVKNLIDIRDNKSGSEYASAFFALRDKYGQVNLYKSLNEYYATGTVTDEDYTAPTSQEIVEQQGQEAFETITDNEAPRSFEDTVFDVFENEGLGYETESKVESPFDTRDIDEVGKRNVKAYQYENPEVRPYFQAEAENMMYDLNNTIKGEKNFNDQLYYDTNGEQGWYGTTRQTTEAIAYLKDKYGYSYAQIEKGLNDIIEDNGKENNAVAKRIEFMLDERLRDGYTTSDGIPIPPNEEYIKFLEEKQITEYRDEAYNEWRDTVTQDENVPPEPTTDDQGRILTKEKQYALKDSMVRDEKGNILTVYHGTNADFTFFKNSNNDIYDYDSGKIFKDTGISFFTDSLEVANTYIDKEVNPNKKPMERYLNIKNPLIIDAQYQNSKYLPDFVTGGKASSVNDIVEKTYKSGKYDGVIFKNISDLGAYGEYDLTDGEQYSTVYVTFNSDQIIDVNNTNPITNIAPEPTRIDVEPELRIDEQVIPTAENIAQNQATGQFELKIDESMPVQENTAQNQNTGLSDTSEEAQEKAKIAQILSEAPTKQNKDQRMWARARAAFFDKGSVFEDISLKTKNRELEAKWDYSLPSEARAQNVLFNGYREFDSSTKAITQTSKGLYDIQAEVGDKVQEFSEYLYHKHNISRMSIEANAQARMAELQETVLKDYDLEGIEKLSRKRQPTNIDKKNGSEQLELELQIQENLINSAKEYMRLSEAKNKPVFGDSVTAEVSQKVVDEYEMNNPEFMDWANDVYDYNKANLKELVKSGVISQETADQFAEIYPHYVPIARANVNGNAINVPLDTNRTGVNAPIARAKGGSQDILPLFDTMARRTLQTYRATAKNNFGVELKNTLNSTIDNQQTSVDEILENVDQQESLLQEGKNGQNPTFTVFENGEKVTYEITQDMYDALKPISDSSLLSTTFKPFNKISNFHRGLLTEYNPVFMLTNAIKDAQDILLNSQHATKTYAKMPEAYAQIAKKGFWYQEYMSHGGEQNSYFDSQEGTFDTENKGISKVLDLPPLKQISQLNNFIEVAPRLAEYIASREAGRSIETSMLDAARVTTNFKAGGDVTKWANRNGATFLNASVQGAMQQVRNVREANAKGLIGYANLAAKFALAGLPAMILNGLLWDDDDDYEELSDYVKQNYYIVGKYGDGNFIRIPKGRMITVVQEGLNQMKNLVTGNDEADLGQFLEILAGNIAPNNPIENNVLAPIIQAVNNKTWYGDDLVPTRLQDEPTEEQYDETTDKLSIFLGQKLGISPYKVNYVLDQYSGGIGDVFLPMMTQQAETGSDSLLEELMSPLTNKFTVDSVMKNQNVSDLYSKSEELASKANSTSATDEDILKNKYLNSIKSEMNELYKEKREIQNSSLSNSEKYAQTREIQDQINSMARNAMDSYEGVRRSGDYASVGNKEYYLKDDTWTKVKEEELSELNRLGMSLDDKNTYFNLKTEINSIKDSTVENKKAAIATTIRDTNFTDEQKAYVYGKNYSSDETLDMVLNTGMSFNEYLNYASQEFVADKDSDGKSISGSRKKKVISYINSLNLNVPQKAMLIRKEYSTFDDYNEDIISYVIELDLTYEEKKAILEEVDMKVSADGRISW